MFVCLRPYLSTLYMAFEDWQGGCDQEKATSGTAAGSRLTSGSLEPGPFTQQAQEALSHLDDDVIITDSESDKGKVNPIPSF